MNNLHMWIDRIREEEEGPWHRNNPGRHPVEWSKYLALQVTNLIKKSGQKEVECHEASFHGTTDYSYVISYLEESGILVRRADR